MQETCLHATLVRVHECGVLIRGGPGAGKSRLALELIAQGHALVADDLVLSHPQGSDLIGRAATAQKGRLALRGVGVVDIARAFGANHFYQYAQSINWVVDLGAECRKPTPEHDTVDLDGFTLPRICLQANSRDATLVALCCQLGSAELHRWKSDDVDH